jgi:Raf kinase inhibitor-like YbhB/YbcL family protein
MHLRSDSFQPWSHLDPRLAFCRADPDSHATFSDNRNPHLAWSGVPAATRSFALICCDSDAPSEGSRVNQEGMTVPLDLPRADFFHWVACDLPAALREIAEGSHAAGVAPRGRAPGPTPDGGVQGINDYTGWFAGDADMSGDYGGYDGPCPPWNDERVHGYRFTVSALDVASLNLSGAFTGQQLRAAMAGHVLAEASITGSFTLYRPTGRADLQTRRAVWGD